MDEIETAQELSDQQSPSPLSPMSPERNGKDLEESWLRFFFVFFVFLFFCWFFSVFFFLGGVLIIDIFLVVFKGEVMGSLKKNKYYGDVGI